MGRIVNRAALLQAYLNEHRSAVLRPGRLDCVLFAAGWVQRCTGRNLAGDWPGSYRSLDEGRGLLAGSGFASLGDLAAHHLEEIDGWARAQVGDVAIVIEDEAEAMSIVGGTYLHGLGVRGLDVVPLSRAVRVFRP